MKKRKGKSLARLSNLQRAAVRWLEDHGGNPAVIGGRGLAEGRTRNMPRRRVLSYVSRDNLWYSVSLSCGHTTPYERWKRRDCSVPKTLGCPNCKDGR
jgi:hypothetical protein